MTWNLWKSRARAADGEARALRLIDQGNLDEAQGRLQQALAAYDEAIRQAPTFARAHLNRGNALLALGDAPRGLDAYAKALALQPDYAAAAFNTGNAQLSLGNHAAAIAAYRQAAELDPQFADAHVALGAVQEDLRQFEQARDSYTRALALRPDYAEVCDNLGSTLRRLGQFDESVLWHRRALALQPGYTRAHINLGNAMKDLGRIPEALASYRAALKLDPGSLDALGNLLFAQHYDADVPPGMLLEQARRYGEMAALRARPHTSWPNTKAPEKPLRVGLVSGDLRQHPVAYFLEAVLAALASQGGHGLQLVAYPTYPCHDALSRRLQALVQQWCPLDGMSDAQAAQRIRADGIDILLDLAGHTAHNRLPLFAWRPAPVQASWLGYFATTGVATMDYLIADPLTLPQQDEGQFVERIWRLPRTRLCFTPPDADLKPGPLPALNRGHITFGCFNNLAKVNQQVLDLWARVLTAVPSSRLRLRSAQLVQASSRQAIWDRFALLGIDASRILLDGLASRDDYLAAYHEIDIALDPFPYPGGTTTVEALWMGVPVLTLAGSSFLSRQGEGLLACAGLPGWIARDAEQYLDLAVRHAADWPALAALRQGLRPQVLASALFDADQFASDLASALRGMWRHWSLG